MNNKINFDLGNYHEPKSFEENVSAKSNRDQREVFHDKCEQ